MPYRNNKKHSNKEEKGNSRSSSPKKPKHEATLDSSSTQLTKLYPSNPSKGLASTYFKSMKSLETYAKDHLAKDMHLVFADGWFHFPQQPNPADYLTDKEMTADQQTEAALFFSSSNLPSTAKSGFVSLSKNHKSRPENIKSLPLELRVKLYEGAMKSWRDANDAFENDIPTLFSKTIQAMSEQSKDLAKEKTPYWDDIERECDFISLFNIIKETHLTDTRGLPIANQYNAEKVLINAAIRQGEAPLEWKTRLIEMRETCRAVDIAVSDEKLAFIFTNGLDNRWGQHKVELANDAVKGIKKYPVTLEEAFASAQNRFEVASNTQPANTQLTALISGVID